MPKTHSKVKGLSVSHRTAHRGDRTLASVCTPTVSGALVGEGGEVARVEELVALSGQYLAQGASFCGASAEDEVAPPASGMREIRRPVSGFARPHITAAGECNLWLAWHPAWQSGFASLFTRPFIPKCSLALGARRGVELTR